MGLHRIIVAGGLAILAAPGDAGAREAQIDIPAQKLARALQAISGQAGVDILFRPSDVGDRMSPAIRGKMDPLAAVRIALRSAPHLEAVRLNAHTLVVRTRRANRPRPTPLAIPPRPSAAAEPAEEIVVTALRRTTPLASYPGSLTLITKEYLRQRRHTSLVDVSQLTPGLNLTETGSGQRRITMRGIHSAGENSVLLYFDDVPVSGPSSATSDVSQMSPDIRLFDIERIEVLRGPQGTLFGSGALGGAVRIAFAQPDLQHDKELVAAAVTATEGGKPGYSLSGTMNLPIIRDVFGIRITAYDDWRGGIVDNIALGIRNADTSATRGVRFMARLEPSPELDLTATFLTQEQKVRDSSVTNPSSGPYRTNTRERLPFPNAFKLFALTGHSLVGSTRVTANLSRYRWDLTRTIDSTASALRAMDNASYCPLYIGVSACSDPQVADYRSYIASLLPLVGSQPMRVDATIGEIRFATPAEAPLSIVAGLFFEKRSDSSHSGTYGADPATGEIRVPFMRNYLRTVSVETRQMAAFADASLRLGERWTFSAGTRRYSYDKKASAEVLQTSYINGAVAGPPQTTKVGSDGWTGRANLAWQIAPETLLYAQVATGFRPGGVNSIPNLPKALVAFASDSALSREIGFRHTGDGFRLGGSAYWTTWKNMQASARVPSFLFVSNSGVARILGLDLEAEATPFEGLRLRSALNLLDARLSKDQVNPVVVAPGRAGDHIPFEPGLKAVASADYVYGASSRTNLTLGADLSYVGRHYSDYRPDSPYYEAMGDYADLAFRFELSRGQATARLIIANALGAKGKQRVESTSYVEQATNLIAPRRLSAEIGWQF